MHRNQNKSILCHIIIIIHNNSKACMHLFCLFCFRQVLLLHWAMSKQNYLLNWKLKTFEMYLITIKMLKNNIGRGYKRVILWRY